jgi:hypothetical protein
MGDDRSGRMVQRMLSGVIEHALRHAALPLPPMH